MCEASANEPCRGRSGPRISLHRARLAAPKPPRQRGSTKGIVYFCIVDEGAPAVKIGFTRRAAKQRIADLQTGSPSRIRLLIEIPGTPPLERELHARFAAYRLHGEWFRLEGELADYIRRLAEAEP